MAIPIRSDQIYEAGSRILGLPPAIANGQATTYEQLGDINTSMTVAFTDCWATSGAGTSPYTTTAISAGTTASSNAAILSIDHPGVIKLRVGATANGGARLYIEGFRLRGGEKHQAWINFNTHTGVTLRIGFAKTTTSADATDGAYFEIIGGVANGKNANNSVRTSTTTSYSSLGLTSSDWYRFDIDVANDLSSARYRIYDKTVALVYDQTVTGNLPPADSGRDVLAGIIATQATAGAADICHVDMLYTKIMGIVR